ncbi:MFS transporter [Aquipuribacter sp. SD81]|uniref:MFS transporter n=1 Tax=Aquipuribacter sp. SD81 TaxID=3127703 RepID=UPI0030159B57
MSEETGAAAPRLDLREGGQRVFAHALASTTVVAVVNATMWFAVTFWVYLETRSVLATGLIAGIFLAATSLTGVWFGSLVDHHRKKVVMQASAAASLSVYAVCLAVYLLTPPELFRDPASPVLWGFVVLLMLGVITGNLRTITMPTLVTLLVPEPVRDRANGLVGTATGVSFLVTSVISGLLVGLDGMRSVLLLGVVVLGASIVHLARVDVPEPALVRTRAGDAGHGVDLRGTLRIVRGVPGLPALIVFSCVNNVLGGAFMALMDAYGLSLVSVQVWGLLWGALSTGVIVGGLVAAKVGLGSNPVRTLLLVNVVLWTVTIVFPMRSSIVLLTAGMLVFMLLMPFAEAAEQTVLQRVVPYERQGRVFGFAQSVELAASPLTAFLVAPFTELVVIPSMTDGAAADLVGGWFGTGADRGIALVFVVSGLLGLLLTTAALLSRPYRRLSAAYAAGAAGTGPAERRGPSDGAVVEVPGPHPVAPPLPAPSGADPA